MAGKTLTDWVSEQGSRDDTIHGWFTTRPDLLTQVRAAKQDKTASVVQAQAWLVEAFDFPFTASALRAYLLR